MSFFIVQETYRSFSHVTKKRYVVLSVMRIVPLILRCAYTFWYTAMYDSLFLPEEELRVRLILVVRCMLSD